MFITLISRVSSMSLAFAWGIFAAGCTSVYHVDVNSRVSVRGTRPEGAGFRLVDKTTDPGRELRMREIAGYVRSALSAHGFFEAPAGTSADMVVEIDYVLENPEVRRVVYQELAFGRPRSPLETSMPPPEGVVARELMGYAKLTEEKITREKRLSICAREDRLRPELPPEEFWRVDVSIESESGDLRGHLAVLLAVAMDYVGRSTSGPVSLCLRSDDEAIRFVRKTF